MFLPRNFFFVNVFSYRDMGVCMALLITNLFNIQNTYIDKILNPLTPLLVANQFYRFEVYHMQNYITDDVLNMHSLISLLIYFVPFTVSWACLNLVRRLCIDWK